jgi:hypothetical protein
MRMLNKDKIKLPYIGRNEFIKLMKMGMKYEKGFFAIKDFNKAEEIKDAISQILKSEVAFPQFCVICNKEFACEECKFYMRCPSRDLPFSCICEICSSKRDIYEQYLEKNNSST